MPSAPAQRSRSLRRGPSRSAAHPHARRPAGRAPTPPQRYIIRLIFMVPVYATGSWFSLKYRDAAIYFDTIRDWCAAAGAGGRGAMGHCTRAWT